MNKRLATVRENSIFTHHLHKNLILYEHTKEGRIAVGMGMGDEIRCRNCKEISDLKE